MPNISAAQVNQAVNERRGRVGPTAYVLKVYDGRIEIEYGELPAGSVRFTTGGGRIDVETINVKQNMQGRGLGKLLVAALCAYAMANSIQNIGLATPDTSGGFWVKYGVGMGGATSITSVEQLVWANQFIAIR